MSKAIRQVDIVTPDGKRSKTEAVLDSGLFYTLIREDCVPAGANILRYRKRKQFGTAPHGTNLSISGATVMEICIEGHWINGKVLVSPQLGSPMLIGAGLMQMWGITIRNKDGKTSIHVGRDMNDPFIIVEGLRATE